MPAAAFPGSLETVREESRGRCRLERRQRARMPALRGWGWLGNGFLVRVRDGALILEHQGIRLRRLFLKFGRSWTKAYKVMPAAGAAVFLGAEGRQHLRPQTVG